MNNRPKRRSAAEIIGFHLGWDMREVSECRYQPTRFANPAIYSVGDRYFAAPSNNVMPKADVGEWNYLAEHYGRKIFCTVVPADGKGQK